MPGARVNYKEGQTLGECIFLNEEESIVYASGLSFRRGNFKCKCGNTFIAFISNVKLLKTKSCGCFHRQLTGERSFIHGGAINKRESGFSSWSHIKTRCRNVNSKGYKKYGAKGITMYDDWYNSFELFISHIGPRPSLLHSVDRFPNKKGNYEPGNVRWATPKEQANNISKNLMIEIKGVAKTLSMWCDYYKIPYVISRKRYMVNKWSIYKVISRALLNKQYPGVRFY